jgi:hypothetical protein
MISCLKVLKLNDTLRSQFKCFHFSNLVEKFSHDETEEKPRYSNRRKSYNKNSKTNVNFLHVKNFDPSSGSNLVKKFRLPQETLTEKNMMKSVKTRAINELSGKKDDEEEDPESLLKNDEDLDLFMENPDMYHRKQIEEDIFKRKQIKRAIIKKKLLKLEERSEPNFNLLTWDAKEQIKYLNLNEPGRRISSL